MTYVELLGMVYAAKTIGTKEAKMSARSYIYVSEGMNTITMDQRKQLVEKLDWK